MGFAARAIEPKPTPSFDLEAALMDQYRGPVAGIDEAGRGLGRAGRGRCRDPQSRPYPEGLNDSKVLTPETREDRYAEIIATALVSVVIGPVKRIDRINILQASLWGMRAAYRGLGVPIGAALIDGNIVPRRFPCKARAVVGGDGLSLSVAAASIVAKVTRDRLMVKLARRYRRYAWDSNKGYGTPEHAAAIKKHGVCIHHRRSFSPIERALRLIEGGGELPLPQAE